MSDAVIFHVEASIINNPLILALKKAIYGTMAERNFTPFGNFVQMYFFPAGGTPAITCRTV